jgi:hypothetical protein
MNVVSADIVERLLGGIAASRGFINQVDIMCMPLRPHGGRALSVLFPPLATKHGGPAGDLPPGLVLRVMACELDTASAATLAATLVQAPTSLKALVIREESGSKERGACGDVGAAAIANALNHRSSRLTTLRLENVGIRAPYHAIDAIARLLKDGSRLTHLSLAGARVSADAMALLIGGVSQSAVCLLCLAGCNLTCTTAAPLVASLRTNGVLRALDLKHNRLRCKTAVSMARVLCENTTLRRLDLQGNLLATSGVQALLGLLCTSDTLHALDIRSASETFELGCAYPSDSTVLRRLTGFPMTQHARGSRVRTRVRRGAVERTLKNADVT